MYKLPKGGVAGVRAVLEAALAKAGPEASEAKGRPRRRSGKKPG
jgi:hypothetical protein